MRTITRRVEAMRMQHSYDIAHARQRAGRIKVKRYLATEGVAVRA